MTTTTPRIPDLESALGAGSVFGDLLSFYHQAYDLLLLALPLATLVCAVQQRGWGRPSHAVQAVLFTASR